MKKIIGIIVVGLVLSGDAVTAQDASRRVLAEELLNVMNVKATIENSFAMIKRMIPAQVEQMQKSTGQTNLPTNVGSAQDKIMDMVSQELSWDKLKDGYVTIYAESFTEKELQSAIAFYKSPEGQAFITKQPELMKRSVELTQKLMVKVMPKIQAMTKEMIESNRTAVGEGKLSK